MKTGPAGRFASVWINSRLTPLFIISALMAGGFSVWMLPREEEPQIKVPMIDVFASLPGASAREVEERLTKPLEKLLWEIPGVEYIYSTSSPGSTLAIVRFKVGEDDERSIVKLNQKISGNADLMPAGATAPMVKARSIDDVPILALTLSSTRYDDLALRRIAAQLDDVIKRVPDVSLVTLIGGRRRELSVTLDAGRLAAYSLSPVEVAQNLGAANQRLDAGRFSRENREFQIEAGNLLQTAEQAGAVVVSVASGRPVYLRDVATITDAGEEASQYVHFLTRAADLPAVTIAISKRRGTNAIDVAQAVLHSVETMRGSVLTDGVEMTITRNYGETAAEKANELLEHMGIAVISVSLLILLALGYRESLIVFTAIPVTLALTLTVFYLYGYTLNRITLFALIFSIGILVDDAIVIVENIARHARMPLNHGRDLAAVAVEAVDEVGNPTILATLTVIAAILPMAFVGGLMGPYMRPIPIGASAAVLFSLVVALAVTPWAAVRILGKGATGHHVEEEDKLTRFYRRVMGTLLHRPLARVAFLAGVLVLLLGACSLVYFKLVTVKMLPFDNKSEFQVIVDMPEGTTLEQTERVTQLLAHEVLAQKEVTSVQTYSGTAAPYNFNGLVRHYFLRRGANMADIQVNLTPKGDRARQSHEIAKAVRTSLLPIALPFGARMKVAEVPPGPPVLATLVAEIYGPNQDGRTGVARRVREIFRKTAGVVDVDWNVEDDQPKAVIVVDQEKAALKGISTAAIARTLRIATAGETAGLLHADREKEDVLIVLRMGRGERSDLERLRDLKVTGMNGQSIALRELTHVEQTIQDKSISHKNLMPVTYVTADVAGALESPAYPILEIGPQLSKIPVPQGGAIKEYVLHLPADDANYAVKWDGEWHITYEVFRDLGLAFAAVLVLIYILVVGWFQSFSTPLVIMAAIPFSLVGILPAHGLMGAFFTATSMIGFIAGAGIVVRNSIILVDFAELRVKQGMTLDAAVIEAGAVRFRPMVLTAAAVVAGSAVILFDPIFQGLAIALMAGEIASLLLSRMAVPILFYVLHARGHYE